MTAPPPISTIRVLLVDDHRTVLWGLEKLIESESPAMVVAGKATSGAEAIEMASQARPDVIVLDSELGEHSGIDAIPQLLERSNAKVLLLTEQRNAQLHDRAVLAGARGIVYKEEPAETIVRAIEKVHKGEVWLDRMTTGRILDELSQNGTQQRREQQDCDSARSHDARARAGRGAGAGPGRDLQQDRRQAAHHRAHGAQPSHQHLQQAARAEPARALRLRQQERRSAHRVIYFL
jgi:DNA-binding NarL/FixJ family response regulator